MNNIVMYGGLTPQEQIYLKTIIEQRSEIRRKAMRGQQLTPQEESQLETLGYEIARLQKLNRNLLQKARPYARIIASGIEYAHSKSIVKAIGALLFPYPYLVYRGYQSYKGKK